ncbi:MAG: hypothetical protein H6Q13_2093 [Bacteroidetes bacterium]|nr:hypothetical protein [Bacteroidota bacterium]
MLNLSKSNIDNNHLSYHFFVKFKNNNYEL